MKSLLTLILCLFSFTAFSKIKDCDKQKSQADKNECMLFERDKAVGKVMTEVGEYCAQQEEIKEAKGEAHHAMLVDECIAKELSDLAKRVERDN